MTARKAEAYKRLNKLYEEKRKTALAKQEEKKLALYERIPRLAEIEKEINLTGASVAKLVIMRKPDEAANVKAKLLSLKEERKTIFKDLAIPEDWLEARYECEKCKDTGRAGDKLCSCFRQKLIDIAYEQSGIRDILQRENFSNFRLDYYSDKPSAEHNNMSPRQNMERALSTAARFIKNFGKEDNLLFYGSTGLGKTFLSNCIAKEILDSDKTVIYCDAPRLFKLIEKEKFGARDGDEVIRGITDDIAEADLLIIDDLGAEFSTMLSSAEFFNIINGRLLTNKPVVISTNLEPKNWIDQYSDRVVSRILGSYKTIEFFGEDIRLRNKFGKSI